MGTGDWGLGSGEWGVRTGDLGLGEQRETRKITMPHAQCPMPHTKFPIPNSHENFRLEIPAPI
ncbi:MAG: hypothetical protein V7K98_11210 [Nostoc sp.]|uniref:hypothetical protein n=1 Tax=Nostoc sp. TaxID=1180 RepID=UPI002FFD17CE